MPRHRVPVWVLLWACLKSSDPDDRWARATLARLETYDTQSLYDTKFRMLSNFSRIKLSGKFSGATFFLRHFLKICCGRSRRDFETVDALFEAFKAGTLEDFPDVVEQPTTPPPRAIPDDHPITLTSDDFR